MTESNFILGRTVQWGHRQDVATPWQQGGPVVGAWKEVSEAKLQFPEAVGMVSSKPVIYIRSPGQLLTVTGRNLYV